MSSCSAPWAGSTSARRRSGRSRTWGSCPHEARTAVCDASRPRDSRVRSLQGQPTPRRSHAFAACPLSWPSSNVSGTRVPRRVLAGIARYTDIVRRGAELMTGARRDRLAQTLAEVARADDDLQDFGARADPRSPAGCRCRPAELDRGLCGHRRAHPSRLHLAGRIRRREERGPEPFLLVGRTPGEAHGYG